MAMAIWICSLAQDQYQGFTVYLPISCSLRTMGKGHFKDVTDSRIKGIKKIGMVTDACWMDYRPGWR